MTTKHTEQSERAELIRHMAHLANEWADAATNGPCYLDNVRDGIYTFEQAKEMMRRDFAHCQEVGERVRAAALLAEDKAGVEPVAFGWYIRLGTYAPVFLEQCNPPEPLTFEEAISKGWRPVYTHPQPQAEDKAGGEVVNAWRDGAKFALSQIAKNDNDVAFITDSMKFVVIKTATDACIKERDRLYARPQPQAEEGRKE